MEKVTVPTTTVSLIPVPLEPAEEGEIKTVLSNYNNVIPDQLAKRKGEEIKKEGKSFLGSEVPKTANISHISEPLLQDMVKTALGDKNSKEEAKTFQDYRQLRTTTKDCEFMCMRDPAVLGTSLPKKDL